MSEHKTHWTDSEGAEWEVKIDYDLQPYEPQTRMEPGCEANVTVNAVYKNQLIRDVWTWVDVTDESKDDHTDLEQMIMEELSEAAQDAEDAHGDYLHDQAKDEYLQTR